MRERWYQDSGGHLCTLNQMTRREPEWAASRIRVGEEAIAERDRLRSELAAAKEALSSIEIFGADTLSGPTGAGVNREWWHHAAVKEMTERARHALAALEQEQSNPSITARTVATEQGVASEVEYVNENGVVVGYWAYGHFDTRYPYQGEQEQSGVEHE